MLKIGLTGGIGSGKTTAANYFQELGVPILDADEIAKKLTQIAMPAYNAIVAKFGSIILHRNQEIDRRKLRTLVFSDDQIKNWLEQLLHPMIKQEIDEQARCLQAPYCIIVIPLLVETDAYDLVDRVLVIDTEVTQQIQRSIQRDATTIDDINNIIHAQASREQRLAKADDIIFNGGDLAALKKDVIKQHHKYLSLANQ